MIQWLRLSVKTDNPQVHHLYPIVPSAADRIYIKCTYQTPLSHLWMHWWFSSSFNTSPHHMFLLPLMEMREQMRIRCQKKSFLYDWPLCVSSPSDILLHFESALPLSLLSLPSMSGLVPYHFMFNTGWGTRLPFPVLAASFSFLPRQ